MRSRRASGARTSTPITSGRWWCRGAMRFVRPRGSTFRTSGFLGEGSKSSGQPGNIPRMRILACLSALALLGCSASSKYMIEPHGLVNLQPPFDKAVVVFVRPSGFARAMSTTILEDNGRFLGDSLPESYFAVLEPPGPHVFIAWAENTAAL